MVLPDELVTYEPHQDRYTYTKDEVLEDHGLTSLISLWVDSLREVNIFPALWSEKQKSRSDLMEQSANVGRSLFLSRLMEIVYPGSLCSSVTQMPGENPIFRPLGEILVCRVLFSCHVIKICINMFI